MEVIKEFFTSGEVWVVVIKVLATAILTGLLGLVGTLIGKLIANSRNSKIYKYAKTCVEAAEQKYPNEGKKMGPEKMQYVMDQLMIKFPKIRDNAYLYNIAEAAVYELNRKLQEEAAIKEFKEKYGETPLAVDVNESVESIETALETTAYLVDKEVKKEVRPTTVIISSKNSNDQVEEIETISNDVKKDTKIKL